MTPPSPAEQVSALSALTGWEPDSSMRRSLAMVMLIARAQERGVTWAQIASALRIENGKMAKAYAKRLAKSCQGEMLLALMDAAEVGELTSEH